MSEIDMERVQDIVQRVLHEQQDEATLSGGPPTSLDRLLDVLLAGLSREYPEAIVSNHVRLVVTGIETGVARPGVSPPKEVEVAIVQEIGTFKVTV